MIDRRDVDCEAFRLRRFLERLNAGDVIDQAAPVALTDVAALLDATPQAVQFRAVGPEGANSPAT